ncbi:TRAP transporter large permease subunit [Lacibacterium aquatile]|uniref:TRAP transporter large permease protein n=1 Tax=Lacibacterium aquatile TaxID=1168082 RepID=A0ABW5DJG3_9PROT
MTIVIFLVALCGLMAMGMPIAYSLMLTGVALMVYLDFFDAQLVAQNLLNGADSFPLMAVPFFMLAGEAMNAGGMSRRIVHLSVTCVGHIRGGLGYVAIVAAIILASLSGSAIADTAALATLLMPMMRDNGYPVNRSAGLLASGGIIAPIIPPSMPFIIYGVATNTSISALFISGIVPGLIMGAGLVVAWKLSIRGVDLPQPPRASWAERGKALKDSLWALALPGIIIGGLRFGIFTPTEAAVVAAVYALFVGTFVYRELPWGKLVEVMTHAARSTATIMFLCAAATVSSYMITLADVPADIIKMLEPIMDDPKLLMLAMMVLLFAVGTAMDLTPTILILGPVLAPVAVKAGIDPVYFGLMFILNGAIGLITPPVGTVLSVVGAVTKIGMDRATTGVWPFLLAYTIIMFFFVFVPEIVTVPLRWML